ncbi:MAG: LysR family transcriptional regulator [Pseudomonadota bacterium]
MIDQLRLMAIFTQVVEKGSFSEAAKTLGLAPSRVSEGVSKLEHFVGVPLLYRTTRKVSLTAEGRDLYAHTSRLVETAQQGFDALRHSKSEPSGSLKISMPSYLASSPLHDTIAAFVETYSQVHISADFTDNDVEPMKDGFDLCIRSGRFETQGLVERRLGGFERIIVVGRDYFQSKETPQHPSGLMTWDWINYRHKRRIYKLKSHRGERATLTIEKQSRLQVDHFDALHFLTKANHGVSVMPAEICREGLNEGKLVRLFDEWRLPRATISAIWPETGLRNSLVSSFVDYLSAHSA